MFRSLFSVFQLLLLGLCCGGLVVVAVAQTHAQSSVNLKSDSFSSEVFKLVDVNHVQVEAHSAIQDVPVWYNYTQKQYVFTQQLVNHFDMINHEVYAERFWIVEDFFGGDQTSPVLFYLCGEYTCPGVMPTRLFPVELAYEFHALIVVIEHRFYGESYPRTLTDDNLYLLNSRQALADFAYFQQWFQMDYLQNQPSILPTPINPTPIQPVINPWIVIGGSYPGALSAWYRLKYPHLVIASIASSAVVEAILDFPAFDEQVAVSAGPECADALRMITGIVEDGLPSIKKLFNATIDLHDDDFLFMIADIGAEGVQYGHREMLCNAIVPPFQQNSSDALLDAFLNYTAMEFYAAMGSSPSDYDRRVWKEPTKGNADRSWGFQTCAELGYWQVAPDLNPIRSTRINRKYYQDLCFDVFGLTDLPFIDASNDYYGGNKNAGTNIFFVNGVEDPWQWASVRSTSRPFVYASVVNCSQCAHCVDLYTPTSTDAPELVLTRDSETDFIAAALDNFLSQHASFASQTALY